MAGFTFGGVPSDAKPEAGPPRWLWIGYLDPTEDPHRVAFLASLDAALRERGERLDVRRLNRTGPDAAGDAPVRRLPGAGRTPADAWFRFCSWRGGAAQAGGRGFARSRRAFASARGIGLLAAGRRAGAVAAAVTDAIDGGPGPVAGLLLWNQFADVSRVAAAVAERRGLHVRFLHEGVLPGSAVLESGGQMADGELAAAAGDPARAASVDSADRAETEAYLAAVRGARLTRKKQGNAAATAAAIAALPGPTLFYAGQNDEAAGFVPRSLPRARWHSPAFTSTIDALRALEHAAAGGGFRLVFKPHPLWLRRHGPPRCAPATVCLPDADLLTAIEHTDATATIVSQAAYHARIHGKPALLLGRMPMTGWGCCTEHLGGRDGLGTAVAAALAGGPADADEAFLRHAHAARTRFLLPYDPAFAAWFPRRPFDA